MAALALLSAGERPAAPLLHLHRAAVVPASLDDTFAFFADAANLERLTPPWLHFAIRTPLPIEMREGTTIDYRVSLRRLQIHWRSSNVYRATPRRFEDRHIVS